MGKGGKKSQSPQIGSMFLTGKGVLMGNVELVAIPSNRVNVSYTELATESAQFLSGMSQSPQIGSMFLTLTVLFFA